jgi:hypothetical protein
LMWFIFGRFPTTGRLFLQKRRNRPENLGDAERREILRQTPALEWSENCCPRLTSRKNRHGSCS